MQSEQIDLYGSRVRLTVLFLLACGFVAICVWIVTAHPSTARRSAEPGSLIEFVAYFGIAFFGLAAFVAAARLFRTGPTLSVGPRGVFDRRLSTDWIGWDAIQGIGLAEMGRQRWVVLRVDPARYALLPLRRSARWLTRLNGSFLGPSGYGIAATDLRGGFPALKAAFDRVAGTGHTTNS